MVKKISLFVSVLILTLASSYFIFAWTEPTASPPGSNVPAPLTGIGNQTINGSLAITSNSNDKIILEGTQSAPHTIYLKNNKGIRFWDDVNGELMKVTNAGDIYIKNGLTVGSNSNIYLNNGTIWNVSEYRLNSGSRIWDNTYGDLMLSPGGTDQKVRVSGSLCLDNVCHPSWPSGGLTSCASCDSTFVNVSGDSMTGNLTAPKFIDSDNSAFYADPSYVSVFFDMSASFYRDRDNPSYYVDPASVSKFNTINLGGVSRSTWPSGADGNDYVNSMTFNTGTGVLTLTRTDGGTVTKNLDGRYLTSCSSCNNTFVNQNGDTMTGNLEIEASLTVFDSSYFGNNLTVNGTMTANKYYGDGSSLTGISGDGNNFVNSIDFNTGTGVLTLGRSGLSSLTKDLDGRYLTSALTSCSSCNNTFVNQNGDTMTGNLEIEASLTVFDSSYFGNNLTVNGTMTANKYYGDGSSLTGISGDGNNFVNSIDFNTGTGVLTLGRSGLSSLTKDLDGRYLTSALTSCSSCNNTFVNTSGDNMSGTLSISTGSSYGVYSSGRLYGVFGSGPGSAYGILGVGSNYGVYGSGSTAGYMAGNLYVSGTCSGSNSCNDDIAEKWVSEKALEHIHCGEDRFNYLNKEITDEEKESYQYSCILDPDFKLEFEGGDVVCFERAMGSVTVIKYCEKAYDKTVLSTINYEATMIIGAEYYPYPVSLTGNIPVKVICDNPIEIGDSLVASDVPGYAIKLDISNVASFQGLQDKNDAKFAKALESCNSGRKIIRAWK